MLQIIVILLLLVLVLLIFPISVAFRLYRIKEIKWHMNFHWLFGLVRFEIRFPGPIKAVSRLKKKPREKTKKRKPGDNVRVAIALLKQPTFRQRAIQFIKDLLCAVHAHDFSLRLRIGLDDPADTGSLWGILGPVAGIAKNLRSAEILIEPDFITPVLEVESQGKLRIVPLQFVALATAFMVSPTTLKALRMLHRRNA
jgi:hypothetical protein